MERTRLVRFGVVAGLIAGLALLTAAGVPILSFLAGLALGVLALVLAAWLLAKAYQAFLWKVGRRLAFSYFLIGVVPIPMVLLLALVTAYVIATLFLGHVFRRSLADFQMDQVRVAEAALAEFVAEGKPGADHEGAFALDYYRQGKRIGGAGLAPPSWPGWFSRPAEAQGRPNAADMARFIPRDEDGATLAVSAERGGAGVVAIYDGDIAAALRKRSGAWVSLELARISDHNIRIGVTSTSAGDEEEKQERRAKAEAKAAFFDAQRVGKTLLDQPMIMWFQPTGLEPDLTAGPAPKRELVALVQATPRFVGRQLLASPTELNGALWVALLTVATSLSLIYAVAVLIALYMIFGLSRAVNRLSGATAAVQAGNFAVRIPVTRRDQLGALQSSFNQMAANLEGLVTTAAQKEVLEKELEIAREVQESLLPSNLPRDDEVEFSTVFEPSAAIGGDYFDILQLPNGVLAVVIADVAGHGLSSGLRMAMIKAGLTVALETERHPRVIFERLDRLVRSNGDRRFFVTATLALLEVASGRLQLINAGHPPTYLLRRGEVREILLPSPPLGSFGNAYAETLLELEAEDVVIWLSDGLIEAADARGEPLGYKRLAAVLAGPAASAAEVRDRLLSAVERHSAGSIVDDDRTMVVMSYRARAKPAEEAPAAR